MKRLATLVLAAGFSLGSLLTMGQGASATPFSDVPANHWAYQAIQSLAADGLVEGYPDGKFKGDRPLNRYEMAVLVARVIAKVQANGAGYASKADLDKLQKLIDALKDELDSLGVRVTNVEDALDALDKRTKLAQSLQLHGNLTHNATMRQPQNTPRTIVNGTGVAQPLYYGGAVAPGRTAGIDPFVNAFLRTPESNNPLDAAGSGNNIRFDDKITLSYAINPNLTVAFPIHILSYNYGGEFASGKFGFQPDILVNVAKSGNLSNLYFRFGQLDNMKSSRVGLTFRAPDPSLNTIYEQPQQPFQKGFQIGAILNGLTEFQVNFSRVDQTLLNTQSGVLDPTGELALNGYFNYIVRPQTGYVQPGAPGAASGALRSNTFTAGNGPLTQVYLGQKAQIGTVYISQFNGSLFNSNGQLIGGTGPSAPPGFSYNDQFNSVVFAAPLPAGSSVTISYVGLNATNNTAAQRYEVNARLNHKIKGLPGAEVGLSFNRLFDFDDLTTTGDFVAAGAVPVSGFGLVSDTVLGLDAQVPLTFIKLSDKTQHPILFGEAAFSKFTPDFRNQAAVTDSAAVVGVRLKLYQATGSLQYQVVGANFIDGAPLRFFGNAPPLYNYNRLNYLPQFFGFANNLGINQQFDAFTGNTLKVAQNPNLTYIYPVFNPFVASGAAFYSAFAPNSQGETLNLNSPIRIGDITVNARLLGQHLSELRPNSQGNAFFTGSTGIGAFVSNKRMTLDKLELGAQFTVPAFGQKVGLNLTGGIEHLSRQDKTNFGGVGVAPLGAAPGAVGYVPINPGTQGPDAAAATAGAASFAATGNSVPFYPNFVDMYHTTYAAAASLPLTKDVVFGATYNSQTFRGSYGTTLTQNIAERKDSYTGSLTYNVPKTTSSVALAFRNYKYTDNVLPTFNYSQNREDFVFSVRF